MVDHSDGELSFSQRKCCCAQCRKTEVLAEFINKIKDRRSRTMSRRSEITLHLRNWRNVRAALPTQVERHLDASVTVHLPQWLREDHNTTECCAMLPFDPFPEAASYSFCVLVSSSSEFTLRILEAIFILKRSVTRESFVYTHCQFTIGDICKFMHHSRIEA